MANKGIDTSKHKGHYADAGDDGFRFIFPSKQDDGDDCKKGGLFRYDNQGHLVTIVGRGGTGKSILALQLVSELLKIANETKEDTWDNNQNPAAFYFTLEASSEELVGQLKQFQWGKKHVLCYDKVIPDSGVLDLEGLNIVPTPSPVEDLTSLITQVRQKIAKNLSKIGALVAIVVDTLGGVSIEDAMLHDLVQVKQLADSHATFLFLLVEDHIYEKHPCIEHFSQSVINLNHNPQMQPSRGLYVQKSRNQIFRSGFHLVDLVKDKGVQVFPSVHAQSAYAHEESENKQKPEDSSSTKKCQTQCQTPVEYIKTIEGKSVIFLMGPPGTFKQHLATKFCETTKGDSTIYVSFKAEMNAVERANPHLKVLPFEGEHTDDSAQIVRFLDARSPLLTPEKILSQIRATITNNNFNVKKAVIWGLRRLADMPNFSGSKAVQFLEALVTLLRWKGITSLLVDWPDIEKGNTLPIVDLCQYILLTRICKTTIEKDNNTSEGDIVLRDNLWEGNKHVALLRVQRDHDGFHRNLGFVLRRKEDKIDGDLIKHDIFERNWILAGRKWEKDPGLG